MAIAERELLERAKHGDPHAVDALLARYERRLYRFGLRMCGSEDAAKEVLQQTLLTAFQQLGDFRGEAKLSTWLYQIARSFCSKVRRRRVDEPDSLASVEEDEALSVVSGALSPEDLAHARQLGEVLEAAILALPPAHREALVLRDVEGLTAEEASKVLGVEVANLKTRLHRARLELRKNLTALLQPTGTTVECGELAQELANFAADDIDQATCQRIEDHLARCSKCTAACESLKRTVSLCRSIPGEEVPAPIRAAVRHALLRPRPR